MGLGIVAAAVLLVPAFPETLAFRKHGECAAGEEPCPAAGGHVPASVWGQIGAAIRHDVEHVWSFLLSSRRILVFLLSFAVLRVADCSKAKIMLQYATKRFN